MQVKFEIQTRRFKILSPKLATLPEYDCAHMLISKEQDFILKSDPAKGL